MKRNIIVLFVFLLLVPQAVSADDSVQIADWNEKGISFLQAGDARKAIEYFQKALSLAPKNKTLKNNISNAYNTLGREFLKKGENLNALDYFKKALRYNPKNVYALVDIGQTYYKVNKMDQALPYLKKAKKYGATLKGLDDLIGKIEGEVDSEKDLQRIDTSHFIIMSDERISRASLVNVKVSCEQAYSRIGSFFGYFMNQKIIVVVYRAEEYRALQKNQPHWSGALYDGKIKVPLTGGLYSKEYIENIIYHEFTHALIREYISSRCPLWLNEGLAVYAETFVRPKRRSFFKPYLRKGDLTPFEAFPADYSGIQSIGQANKLYREFYFAAEFLISRIGSTGIRKLLGDLGRNEGVDSIIKRYLALDTAEFSQQLQVYIESKLGY